MKDVMQDSSLTIESKAIYGYLCSQADDNGQAEVSVVKILEDLSISKDRFYRHMNALIDSGYVSKKSNRDTSGKAANNIYTVEHLQQV